MYLSRIKLVNWKNFREVDARVGPRLFLLGPNASGKSNLFDALRFLRDVADRGLREAVDGRGGVGPIRCLAARQYSEVVVEVEVSDEAGPAWSYRLEFNQNSQRVPVVRRERVVRLTDGMALLDRPDEDDRQDELRLTQSHLEQIIANRHFRELAGAAYRALFRGFDRRGTGGGRTRAAGGGTDGGRRGAAALGAGAARALRTMTARSMALLVEGLLDEAVGRRLVGLTSGCLDRCMRAIERFAACHGTA